MSTGVQLTPGVVRQVRALGQVLAQPAIPTLVGPSLSWAYGSAKTIWIANRWAKRSCSGHRFATIRGQRIAQQGGPMPEPLGESLSVTRALHKGSLDAVAFPVGPGGTHGSIGFRSNGNTVSPSRREMLHLALELNPSLKGMAKAALSCVYRANTFSLHALRAEGTWPRLPPNPFHRTRSVSTRDGGARPVHFS
jgi:hypothetical protein